MKTAFKLLLVLAIANLFAFGGFVGWLVGSGRLDADRVERLRAMLAETVAEEKARLAREEEDSAVAATAAADERRLRELPMARAEQIVASERFEERAARALRALEDERRRMEADLAGREEEITSREEALVARQAEWEASIADAKARETSEQFRKAVRLLEAAPAKQSKEWILELIRSGRGQMAVTYLDAMNQAKSAALLKAFKGEDEAAVATDLLERLRVLGLESEVGRERTNAANPAEPDAVSARAPSSGGGAPGAAGAGPTPNGALALPERTGSRAGEG
ncbi:MAG: hypothetical protein RI967_1932 [Planctomycetota bacterium]|jgi:hypothetical protein